MATRQGFSGAVSWYEPGRDAAERHPDWVIRHERNLHVPEVMCTRRKVILLERESHPTERRCSLAHAIAHIDLGHLSRMGVIGSRQERGADLLAARRLVPIPRLIRCWLPAESFAEVAEGVEVTERFLRLRIDTLRKSERAEVGDLLREKVWVA